MKYFFAFLFTFSLYSSFGQFNMPQQHSGLEGFSKNGLVGIMDYDKGRVLVKPIYKTIGDIYTAKNLRIVTRDSTTFVIDIYTGEEYLHGYEAVSERPSVIDGVPKTMFLAKKKDASNHSYFGLVSLKNEVLVPFDFSDIGSLYFLPFVLVKKDSLFTIYDTESKTCMKEMYHNIQLLSYKTKMAWAENNGKGGIIDFKGKIISPFIYSNITYYNSRWENRTAILEQMRVEKSTREEFYLLKTPEGKSSIIEITKSYNQKLPVVDSIYDRYKGFFIVEKDKKMGLMNMASELLVPFKYDRLTFEAVNDSLIVVMTEKNKKFGALSLKGEVLVAPDYKSTASLQYNRFRVRKDTKYALCNMHNKLLTGFDYSYIGSFMMNSAAIILDGKLSYIDTTGKVIEAPSKNIIPRGFQNIDSLYYQAYLALKAGTDSALYQFSKLICPDEFTKDYFERSHCGYRGFPQKLKTENKTVQDYYESYFTRLKNLSEDLKRHGDLQTLQFIQSGGKGFGFHKACFLGEIFPGTENHLEVKLNNKSYLLKLGEIFRIDGYWKSFTSPKDVT